MSSIAWTVVKRLLNVPALLDHVAQVKQARVDGSVDPELDLYTEIFRNDFLHAVVAYFDIEFSHCHKPVRFSTGPHAK